MFCGVPDFLIISKVSDKYFPKIKNLTKAFGITQTTATSGFHAGIRDIRTWEDEIKWMFYNRRFEELKDNTTRLCANLCTSLNGKSKLKKWRENLKEGGVSLPPTLETFLQYYV